MITFEKSDPISINAQKHYFEVAKSKPSFSELEELLKVDPHNTLKNIGVSYYYLEKFPERARGYLSAYDNLYKIGYDGDSLAIIKLCIKKMGYHPLAVSRLITRYSITREYKLAAELISSCPKEIINELRSNQSFTKTVTEICQYTLNPSLAIKCGITTVEITKLSEEILSFTNQSEMETPDFTEKFNDLVSKKEYAYAEKLCWLAYNSGERSERFFNAVIRPLPTELDVSARVIFFRVEAARTFNKNPDFIALGAKSFLYMGEVSSAYEATNMAIENSATNAEILYIHARCGNILGKGEPTLKNITTKSHDDLEFYNFLLQRKYSQSILSESQQSEMHYITLAQASGLRLQNPLLCHTYRTSLKKNLKPRVAICVSGQIRGIEKSSKSLIEDLAKKTDGKIFIDTWKTQIANFPTFTRVQRLIGNELWKTLPPEARMPDGFRRYFPRTTKKLTTPITTIVTHEHIKNFIPDATVRIEDEKIFDKITAETAPRLMLRGNFNQAKMFYKIKKCQELLDIDSSDNGIEYDVVIRTRPDLEIKIPNLDEYIEATYKNQNLIYVSYVTAVGYGDQFAIGSKRAMDIYSSIWEKIWTVRNLVTLQTLTHKYQSLQASHLQPTTSYSTESKSDF